MINRCKSCGRWSHPPAPICRGRLSVDIEPQQSCGTGSVLTYTVNRQQWSPQPIVPYVIAVVGLDDEPGLRVTTRLVGVDPEIVTAGMRVKVCFERVEDDWLPLFHPEGTTR
jgi:uncharacterized protein